MRNAKGIISLFFLILLGQTGQVGLRNSRQPEYTNISNCLEYIFQDGSSVCSKCRSGFILKSNDLCVEETGDDLFANANQTLSAFANQSFKEAIDPDVRYNKIDSHPFLTGYSKIGGSKYAAGSYAPNVLDTLDDKILGKISYHHEEPPHMYNLPPSVELGMLTAQIAAGGRKAKNALVRLNTLANHVGMDKYMRSFLPIALACKSLYIREQEDVNVKMLCGSLFSRITNTPVTSQYADLANGTDYGKVSTIVMPRPSRIYRPDKEVQKIREGADLEHILDDKPLEYYEE